MSHPFHVPGSFLRSTRRTPRRAISGSGSVLRLAVAAAMISCSHAAVGLNALGRWDSAAEAAPAGVPRHLPSVATAGRPLRRTRSGSGPVALWSKRPGTEGAASARRAALWILFFLLSSAYGVCVLKQTKASIPVLCTLPTASAIVACTFHAMKAGTDTAPIAEVGPRARGWLWLCSILHVTFEATSFIGLHLMNLGVWSVLQASEPAVVAAALEVLTAVFPKLRSPRDVRQTRASAGLLLLAVFGAILTKLGSGADVDGAGPAAWTAGLARVTVATFCQITLDRTRAYLGIEAEKFVFEVAKRGLVVGTVVAVVAFAASGVSPLSYVRTPPLASIPTLLLLSPSAGRFAAHWLSRSRPARRMER